MEKGIEIITSRQNPLVKLTASLAERKFREREGLFRFDGKKLFWEALQAEIALVAVLLRQSVCDSVVQALGSSVLPQGCRLAVLPDELFDRISEEKAPDGVICVAKRLDKIHKIIKHDEGHTFLQALCKGNTVLAESVRDPGNLGTLIRSAAAFGAAQVVLSGDCADLYHPRTLRAAMGTLFHTRVIVVEDLPDAIRCLRKNGRVYAAALDSGAARLGQCSFGPSDAVVIGNEGHGLSREVLEACVDRVYIPMAGGVESLNAGVAASILLWEFYRGR